MQSAKQKSCHLVCYSHWRNLPICGPLHHTYSRWCSLSSGWCTRMNLPIHRNPVFCYRPNAKQNNELPLGIDHVLRTLIFHWGYVNFYTYFSKKKLYIPCRGEDKGSLSLASAQAWLPEHQI
jgi:hypothetical protein